jgi:maltodextrin utilization protein YvdJ
VATSGAYYNTAFNFTYAVAKASDPTVFFTSTFTSGEVKVSKRSGSGAITTANIASLPVPNSSGLMNISLTASEMQADEITVEFIPSTGDFGARAVSITTEPTPGDILEVQKSAISGVADFRATGFSTFDASTDTVTTDSASRTASQANVSGLATASALATVDTEVGQIKAKTDQLTFTVSNQVDANALTGGGDATSSNQSTIISHLTDMKGAGWTSTDNLAEITEDVTGLNGAAMRGTDGAVTTAAPTAAAIYSEFTSGSNEDAFKADVSGLSTFDPSTDTVANVTTTGSVTSPVTTDSASRTASQANVSGLATASSVSSIATDVSSILADTSTDGVVISTAQAQALADEVLKRSVTNTQDSADAHSLAAIVLGILESSRSATTWTIKKTDGSTFTSKVLTLDPDADPVVGVD